jgi:hypothetical protein
MSANVDWQEIHRLIEQLYADKVRELLAHALEEARFRQESCFRMWLPVGGSWRGQPHLPVMPKGHTNRSFAPPPGPSAPFSPRS